MSTTAFLPNVASFIIPLTGKTLQLLPLNAIILMENASIFGRTRFHLPESKEFPKIRQPLYWYYYTIKKLGAVPGGRKMRFPLLPNQGSRLINLIVSAGYKKRFPFKRPVILQSHSYQHVFRKDRQGFHRDQTRSPVSV